MIKKLRIKFVCVMMAIVTVMLAVILVLVISFTGNSMRMQSIEMMQTLGKSQMHRKPPGKAEEEVRIPSFRVQVGPHGEILSSSGGDYFDLSDEAHIKKIVDAAFAAEDENGELGEYDLRFLKRKTPDGYIIVFTDIATERITLQDMVLSSVMIFLMAEVLFLGISILLSHWVIKPVAVAWEQQRQFVADASHELKTPLAVIMANAELLQSPELPENEKQKFSGNILTTTYQMRALVENMLEMARVDSGTLKMELTDLDLSQLVSDAALSFQLLAQELELSLVCTAQEGIAVNGSEQHLFQVMDVLLDNALKYSAPGGTIRVELRRYGRACILSVSNPGEPISNADLKNIFKRFYRADKARARDGSYGLGLSIAESVVQAHKGKIWAQSSGGSNTFFVQLPTIHAI